LVSFITTNIRKIYVFDPHSLDYLKALYSFITRPVFFLPQGDKAGNSTFDYLNSAFLFVLHSGLIMIKIDKKLRQKGY